MGGAVGMTLQKALTVFMLVSLMLNAGLQVDRKNLTADLKNYSLLARALVLNVLIVPIFGVVIVNLFRLPADIASGVLLMAIAPGVPFVVQAAGRKGGGSLGLAVTLAFIMPALSILTFEPTAALVLPPSARANLSFANFATTLVLFQLVPLLAGLLIADRLPGLASRLAPLSFFVFAAVLFVILVFTAPTIFRSVATVYGSRGIVAMLTIVVLSLATGWLLGGPGAPYRRTLGIATALRNVGLGLFAATTLFPETRVQPAVLTYLLVQAIIVTAVVAYLGRVSKARAALA
jgi:bile acid:Na+ symporter, BASS family